MRDVIAAIRPQSSFREIVQVYSSSGVEVVGVGKKDEEFSKEGDWKRGKDRERSRNIKEQPSWDVDVMRMEVKVLCKRVCDTLSHAMLVRKMKKCTRKSQCTRKSHVWGVLYTPSVLYSGSSSTVNETCDTKIENVAILNSLLTSAVPLVRHLSECFQDEDEEDEA